MLTLYINYTTSRIVILELSPVINFGFIGLQIYWYGTFFSASLQSDPLLSFLYAKERPVRFGSGFKFSKLLGHLNVIFGTHGNICVVRIKDCLES